jgi:hypothetical protein
MVILHGDINFIHFVRITLLVFLFVSGSFTLIAQIESLRLAPDLIDDGKVKSVLIKVTDSTQFVNWAGAAKKYWTLKSLNHNIFEVTGLQHDVVDEFREAACIISIDRGPRIAKEETVFGEFDRTLNAITAAHAIYPTADGSAVKISVKEKPFNTEDIDLRGRVVLNNQFDEAATQHATFMASIAAGGGNSNSYAKGAAWAAKVTTSDFSRLLPDEDQSLITQEITVQNHSYGVGLENYYGIESSEYDRQVYSLPTILHVFSSGNEGTKTPADGTYAGIPNYANLTGQFKTSKNTITVGSSDKYGNVVPLSSRGPAHDGRIKPELIAYGDAGSSESAAVVSGIALMAQDAYKEKYNALPDAAFVKAAMINGAQDSGRPHVDFETGYGSVNALHVLQAIDLNHFHMQTVTQDEEKVFTISIPADQHQLKVTLVWTDPAATPLVSEALVNDLDISLHHINSGDAWSPWVLDSSPDVTLLKKEAVRGVDRVNNVEQITLDNPPAGDYEIRVKGFSVSSATQKFYVVYDWFKEVEWINPHQGTALTAGSINILRWSWHGAQETANLEYRILPDGAWTLLENEIELAQQYYEWMVPEVNVQMQVRISTSNFTSESDAFTVSQSERVRVGFNCEEEVMLRWNKVQGAQSYEVYSLGEKYLEPFLTVADTFAIVSTSQIATNYFSVTPIINGLAGARDATVDYTQQGVGCYLVSFTSQQYLINKAAQFELLISSNYELNSVSLERLEGSVFKNIETISPVSQTSFVFTDPNPQPGNNYYRARIDRKNKAAVFSESVEVVQVNQNDLFVFPNPVLSGEELNIILDNEEQVIIRIFDMQGRLIRGVEDFGAVRNIDTSNLMAGIYFVKVYKPDGSTLTTKIMIQ